MNKAELSAGLSATPQYRYADRLGNRLFVAGDQSEINRGQTPIKSAAARQIT